MKSVLGYLKKSVQRFPDKTAFADVQTSITYQELDQLTDKIASGLIGQVEYTAPVAVFMEKSVDAVVAFLGIVKAGGFYVLLDPRQPASRVKQILDTLCPSVLIYEEKNQKSMERLEFHGKPVELDTLKKSEICENDLQKVARDALDLWPLYCIFTSGSTGTPKGVLVSHRSVLDFMDYFPDLFQITSEDVIGNQAPFDFDVSVKDIYTTLRTGATMQIIPKQFFSFPTKLLDFLCERKITTLIWAVSALCMVTTLKGFAYKVPYAVNKVLFSGEAMPLEHLRQWQEQLPQAMFVNLYGPTEITCNCTYQVVDRIYALGETLPMGIAFPNEKVFLLDEEDRLVEAPKIQGELCVSGTALALGYYNNPEQTKRAFTQNPLNNRYLEPIYRTGDLAYYNEEGLLCFAGRKDFQIKHMGHRIELGEIEIAMEGIEGVNRALCIFDEKHNKIVGFYQGELTKKELARALGKILPAFMIPNEFLQISVFPITKNGKADRKELMKRYES